MSMYTCEDKSIDIITEMREAGAQVVFMDIDTPYFQYSRTYRGIGRNAIERLDRRATIYIHNPHDVQVFFNPCYGEEFNMESRDFKTLKGALEWSEKEIK